MKRNLILFASFLLIAFMTQAQSEKKLTAAEYHKAENMLDENLSKFIDNDIRPRWTSDNRVLYTSSVNAKISYKLFEPTTKNGMSASSAIELDKMASLPTEETKPNNRNETTSPDGKKVAFIKDWNLWIRDIASGNEKALTTDGVKDFGYATDNAGWKHSDRPILSWSPDSKKLATFQQDQRHVKDMYLVKTTVGAPELQAWKYPLPGDEDIIRIHRVIIDIAGTPKVTRLKMSPDPVHATVHFSIHQNRSFRPNIS